MVRLYHRDNFAPTGEFRRTFGPLNRFDHHRPTLSGEAQEDPDGRSIIYVGSDVRTCGIEVFGSDTLPFPIEAPVCERWTVATVVPVADVILQDVMGSGAADLRALQSLGSGNVHRSCSQEWARAIYKDTPADPRVSGVRYLASRGGGESFAVWDTAAALLPLGEQPLQEPDPWAFFWTLMRTVGIAATRIPVRSCSTCLDHGIIDPAAFVPLP